jgi:hypothetical protein
MASRVVFVCHENGEAWSPGIYLHLGGERAFDLLRGAAPRMCMYDSGSAAAQLCAYLCEHAKDVHGVDLWPPPETGADGKIDWEAYSPGDWGVVTVDVLDARADGRAGALAGQVALNLPFDQSCL